MKASVGALAPELEAKIEAFHTKEGKTLAFLKSTPTATPSGQNPNALTATTASPARTHARPLFTDDELAKTLKRDLKWEPDFLTLHELENSKKLAVSNEVTQVCPVAVALLSEIHEP